MTQSRTANVYGTCEIRRVSLEPAHVVGNGWRSGRYTLPRFFGVTERKACTLGGVLRTGSEMMIDD